MNCDAANLAEAVVASALATSSMLRIRNTHISLVLTHSKSYRISPAITPAYLHVSPRVSSPAAVFLRTTVYTTAYTKHGSRRGAILTERSRSRDTTRMALGKQSRTIMPPSLLSAKHDKTKTPYGSAPEPQERRANGATDAVSTVPRAPLRTFDRDTVVSGT